MANNVDYYISLLEDTRRIAAFSRAIKSVVRPGDRVVEIGSGVGTYALLAAQAGAAEVVAVERDPVAIALSREAGLEKAGGGRIRLVEGRAQDLSLSPRADVIIFEDWGSLGYHGEIRRLLEHARRQLARADAKFIPREIELHLAPVRKELRSLRADEKDLPFTPEAIRWLRKRALNEPTWYELREDELLGPGVSVGSFRPAEGLPQHAAHAGTTRASRSGPVNALAGWMTLHLSDTERIDSGPSSPRTSWKPIILPFEEPLAVAAGEELRVAVEVAQAAGPSTQFWRWSLRAGAGTREGSNANALPADVESLRYGSPEYVPRPGPRSAVVAEICKAVDGRRTVVEIANGVYHSHKTLFATETDAVDLVLEVLERLRGVT